MKMKLLMALLALGLTIDVSAQVKKTIKPKVETRTTANTAYIQKQQPAKDVITVDADFPGGNIVLDSITKDTVFVHHDLRDTQRNWFYWNFRVKGVTKGKTLVFKFIHPWPDLQKATSVIGVHGPGISLDQGKTWTWLGVKSVSGDSFKYQFSNDDAVQFSMGMPYTEANMNDFLKSYKNNINLERDALATTRGGRQVERIHLGMIHGEPKHRVVISSRIHASEMMTSYLVEGIIQETLAGGEAGNWLCKNTEILIIPFVDKDGVEKGEQGKYRRARDHNVDFVGESIYPENQAIRSFVPVWSRGKLATLIDLHCPYLKGKGGHESIHLVEPDSTIAKSKLWTSELRKFAAFLEKNTKQETKHYIPYRTTNNLKSGQDWNKPGHKGRITEWALDIPRIKFATTLEFPYANILEYPYAKSETMVTQENARIFGRTIAKALYEYLRDLGKPNE